MDAAILRSIRYLTLRHDIGSNPHDLVKWALTHLLDRIRVPKSFPTLEIVVVEIAERLIGSLADGHLVTAKDIMQVAYLQEGVRLDFMYGSSCPPSKLG